MLIRAAGEPPNTADEAMPTAIDGTTTLKLKLTFAEWFAVGAVLVSIGAFAIQGDRRITQVENLAQAAIERTSDLAQDIKDINVNMQKLVDYKVTQERFDQRLSDMAARMQRIENKLDDKP